jgi:2-polyprenyl-3-methyl-5-hydroxy-6-metoxy-1,4-benzoquinol methylase
MDTAYEGLAAPQTVRCPLCNSGHRRIAETVSGYHVNRCEGCELVFSEPIPSEQTLTQYYQGFKYSAPSATAFAHQSRYTRRGASHFLPKLEQILGHKIASALDFGGGVGFFSAAMSEHVPDVTLFDLDQQALDYAADHFPGQFAVARSPRAALGRKYDVILVNQVIEHARDAVVFLEQFLPALADDGCLIVTTPNNRTDDALYRPDIAYHYFRSVRGDHHRMVTDSWLCCDPPRHLYAFNAENLGRAAARAGLHSTLTETAYWQDDPYGQPKYAYKGWGGVKNSAHSVLWACTAISGQMARLFDQRHERGTTLISYMQRN